MHTVLSIQSHVAFGHAGNSAAVFPLQRAGVDVWPVHTVTFSNNTSYGSWRGPHLGADDVLDVVRGIDERDALGRVDALLCGYQGSPEMGRTILAAKELVQQRNPEAIFCCDPVMGDVGRGFYAREGIPEFIRDHVVSQADIVTPNLFELEFLSGRTTTTAGDVLEAAHALRAEGPEIVVVTSVVGTDLASDRMRMFAVTGQGAWTVETPLLPRVFTGSGDLTTATFLTHWMEHGQVDKALGATASVVYSILEHTTHQDSRELLLVECQNDIVDPRHVFTSQQVE